MSEKKDKESKTINLHLKDGFSLSDNIFSNISGSINQGYAELKSTFNVNQNRIAETYNLDRNVPYLKQMAEAMDKTVKLAEEQRDLAIQQRDSAVKDAKKQIKLTYITIGIAIVTIVVTIILAFI